MGIIKIQYSLVSTPKVCQPSTVNRQPPFKVTFSPPDIPQSALHSSLPPCGDYHSLPTYLRYSAGFHHVLTGRQTLHHDCANPAAWGIAGQQDRLPPQRPALRPVVSLLRPGQNPF